jgi:hypothetical protein
VSPGIFGRWGQNRSVAKSRRRSRHVFPQFRPDAIRARIAAVWQPHLAIQPAVAASGIIDHIGIGDAFADGVPYSQFVDLGEAAALGFGFAAACPKHSAPGVSFRWA